MPLNGRAPLRVARPSLDLAAAERFWCGGLGLDVLYRADPRPEPAGHGPGAAYALLMVGWRDAGWHLELALDPDHPVRPEPSEEDLLVVYTAEPVEEALVARLERHGGTRVPARNPYWDAWGVTVADPDGYRLVLSTRDWSNAEG